MDHTHALGVSYLPMDEQGRPQTLISQGVAAQNIDTQDWESVLAAPPIRTQCRLCLKQQLIADTCPLFSNPIAEAHNIFCIRVNQDREKLGILSLYLPKDQGIDPQMENYIQTLADITALAIRNLRLQKANQRLQEQRANQSIASVAAAEIEQAAILAERNRLGREIHDGLAQILGYVKMQLSQMEDLLAMGAAEKLTHSIRNSHQAMTEAFVEAREAIDDLRASTLKDNFFNWIHETAANFQDGFGIRVEIADFPDGLDFSLETKNQLTRIIQEALSNIRKHAQAKSVRISCRQDQSGLAITIQDDGKGFDTEEVMNASRHGLRSMPERAALIGARFNIQSGPSQGTTVEIRIPQEARA